LSEFEEIFAKGNRNKYSPFYSQALEVISKED